MKLRATMVGCESVTTSAPERVCRMFTITAFRKKRLKQSSLVRYKTYVVARIAIGQTADGRYFRVVYVPDEGPRSVFVITAYELGPKAKRAFRRKLKRKK
jgi:hypothetical protein